MAAMTKNRNFFKWPKLLYFKPQGSFQQSLVEIGSVVSEEKILFLISSPLFSIFSLAAILVGIRDPRTQFGKGAIQGSFHKSLVAIGPVVSLK
jgi:hypothetical protein